LIRATLTLELRQSAVRNRELEALKNQLSEARTRLETEHRALQSVTEQRDDALREVEVLKSRLATAKSRLEEVSQQVNAVRQVPLPVKTSSQAVHSVSNQAAVYVGGAFLTLAALFTSSAFQEVQSNVGGQQSEVVAVTALETAQPSAKEKSSTDKKKPAPTSGKGKTRVARARNVEHQQWGPALLMPDPAAAKPAVAFDATVQEQQKNLLALGFDLGEADGFKGLRTSRALEEFTSLYLPESSKSLTDAQLSAVIRSYANLARNDADRLGMDRGVLAAIRLSSVRTGVDFSYLMKLAAAESNFEPGVEATGSSAMGLYQFTRDTWLNTVKKHGASYGLSDYAGSIEFYVTRGGYQRPMVKDKQLLKHLLELRKNPRVSAMMVAETVRDNQRKLSYALDREPTQTDLYLTHFLGTDGAIAFLKALQETPDVHAGKMFPAAAKSNRDVFHSKPSAPRTVDEVYELFGNKFTTTRYDELALN